MKPELAITTAILLFTGCSACSKALHSPPQSSPFKQAGLASQASVLQYHKDAGRTGFSIDPLLTKPKVATFHEDTTFNAPLQGPVFAQPLYVEKGSGGHDVLIVATEQNQIIAFSSASGAVVWSRTLAPPVPLSQLPCGNIDPLGITGTPVVDPGTNTLYVDAMTTPDGGTTKKHLVYAISIEDGSVRTGWPADLTQILAAQGVTFQSEMQNQRGALAILNNTVYVPFGGLYGDCGTYHGWVIGISTAAAPSAQTVKFWATPGLKAGIWSPVGVSSDNSSLFVATGNTSGASAWSGGEAVIRLNPGPSFDQNASNYFAPPDWATLDAGDIDIGSSGPVVFSIAGATPSDLILQMGKNGLAYLLDRANLGGMSPPPVAFPLTSSEIITAPTVYPAPSGTYIAANAAGASCPSGQSGELVSLKITPAAPPSLGIAWCASVNGLGSPMSTSSDGTHDPLVWAVGSESDNILRAFNGETGAVLFASSPLGNVRRYMTPISAKGRVFVASDSKLAAFTE